jgi:hypothetical protein
MRLPAAQGCRTKLAVTDRGAKTLALALAVTFHAALVAIAPRFQRTLAPPATPAPSAPLEVSLHDSPASLPLAFESRSDTPNRIEPRPASRSFTKPPAMQREVREGSSDLAAMNRDGSQSLGASPPQRTTPTVGDERSRVDLGIGELTTVGQHRVILPVARPQDPARALDRRLARDSAQLSPLVTADAGPVVSAVRAAAATDMSIGSAVFVAEADSAGVVRRVYVSSASGDVAAFRALCTIVVQRLGPTRVKIPPGASGARVHVEFRAEISFPSGAKTPIEVGLEEWHGLRIIPKVAFDGSDIGSARQRRVLARPLSFERID